MKLLDQLRVARANLQAQKDENAGLWKYIEKLRADLKEKEAPLSGPLSDRVMPNHGIEPEHVENETCWCGPTFDGLANRWNHNPRFPKKSRAILTHSAHG